MELLFANGVKKNYLSAMEMPFIADGVRRDGIEFYFDLSESLDDLRALIELPDALTTLLIQDETNTMATYEGYTVPVGVGVGAKICPDPLTHDFPERYVAYISLAKSCELDAIAADLERQYEHQISTLSCRVSELEEELKMLRL